MSSKPKLTREDLFDWVKAKGCKIEPIEGLNTTGYQIKITSHFNGVKGYAYLDLPINDKPVPDFVVCKVCDDLNIDCPDCVKDQSSFVNHLKEKFADKKRR